MKIKVANQDTKDIRLQHPGFMRRSNHITCMTVVGDRDEDMEPLLVVKVHQPEQHAWTEMLNFFRRTPSLMRSMSVTDRTNQSTWTANSDEDMLKIVDTVGEVMTHIIQLDPGLMEKGVGMDMGVEMEENSKAADILMILLISAEGLLIILIALYMIVHL
jgi:hypothetical protein